jgi:hypothetical protein
LPTTAEVLVSAGMGRTDSVKGAATNCRTARGMDMNNRIKRSAVAAFLLGLAPGATTFAVGDFPFADGIWDQLDYWSNQRELDNYRVRNFVMGKLADDDSDYWTFRLERDTDYTILGVCDSDCTDVDIIVTDEDGNEIIRDTLVDDHPTVQFRPRFSGTYEVEVRMYACNVTSYCYWGMGIYEQ